MTPGPGERWIRFLRLYGPLPRNDNMFDEHIRRSAQRLDVEPIHFRHPLEEAVLQAFDGNVADGRVVVLTGTAGDGKSHLCGRVWSMLGGSDEEWKSDDIYFELPITTPSGPAKLHVVRDLTALPEHDRKGRYVDKRELLLRLAGTLFGRSADVFLVAANDGQLIEAWRKLGRDKLAVRALALFEARLMDDDDPEQAENLRFFNLSTVSSATVLGLSLRALLEHEGWKECYAQQEADGFFSERCPIRRNYESLRDPSISARLHALFRLCDASELHTPIRRVLMLLANALLGHPAAKDRLMFPSDVAGLVARDKVHLGSLFGNVFGANLGANKRESLEIFQYLTRFGIGHETTNRIDNILIFGAEDEGLREYYDVLLGADEFYGATSRFKAARNDYVEMPEAAVDDRGGFLDMLAAQRRRLFFTLPEAWAEELKLWQLTVFTGAGEYLDEIFEPLSSGRKVSPHVLGTIVRGLNRIFTGLFVSSDRELLLASSLASSNARVSQILEDRIAVAARGRVERVDVRLRMGHPSVEVCLPNGKMQSLRLNLTRFEFLARVADGALPGNFSRECYEDIMSFKSALLSLATSARSQGEDDEDMSFRLLRLDAEGNPIEESVGVHAA